MISSSVFYPLYNVIEDWLKNGDRDMFDSLNTFKELKPEYQEYVLNQIDQLLKP